MPDVLIRDVPDDVLVAIDRRARSLGLSRSEYLRRQLARERTGSAAPVTEDHLVAFGAAFADLAHPEVMAAAWR
jgi:hypothetical protein